MGYYSDVAFTIYKKDAYDLLKRAEERCPAAYELLRDMDMYDHGDAVSFVKEFIKWNDDFCSVDFIMTYLEHLDNCSFRQVGEDFVIRDNWDNGDDLLWECVQINFNFEIANCDMTTTCAEFLESYKPEPIKEPPLDTNMLLNNINAAEALIEEIRIAVEDFNDVPEGRDVKSQCIMVDGGLGFLKRCIGYLEEALSEECPEE